MDPLLLISLCVVHIDAFNSLLRLRSLIVCKSCLMQILIHNVSSAQPMLEFDCDLWGTRDGNE